jgi:hypothetical protein
MPKISQIVDPSFRTGVGKKGAWVLMKVETDDGKQATMFAPAAVGDEVELAYNDEYKNYNATKVKPSLNSPTPSNDALERIEKKVDQILFKVNGMKTATNIENLSPSDFSGHENTDLPPVENYGEVPF